MLNKIQRATNSWWCGLTIDTCVCSHSESEEVNLLSVGDAAGVTGVLNDVLDAAVARVLTDQTQPNKQASAEQASAEQALSGDNLKDNTNMEGMEKNIPDNTEKLTGRLLLTFSLYLFLRYQFSTVFVVFNKM